MLTGLNPQLLRWHNIVNNRDVDGMQAMLAQDVTFHSPYAWEPYHGRELVTRILTTVDEIFEDFSYHRELIDGCRWALEFSARVNDIQVKGIDLIRINDDNTIGELEVFIRPAAGLRALGLEMARRLR